MNPLKISIKLIIASDDPAIFGNFGPGIVSLLKGIQRSGSLNQSAKDMNMSYSKAWRIIREAEEMLGFKLIDRLSGSKGSLLTAEGIRILDLFESTKAAAIQSAEEIFYRGLREEQLPEDKKR
ncbi:MAG: LysR family transcriptional regulator [Tissierellia bacterium]|nr:LysR family transcriptional regulator [Tissierellia bacterium]